MQHNAKPMKQSSVIWVLVADGGSAQIYRYHKSEEAAQMHGARKHPYAEGINRHELTVVNDMEILAEARDNIKIGHDKRGSLVGGQHAGHSTYEPHIDNHDEIKHNLVIQISAKLKHATENKAFDCLIIAAAPKILGALRQHLDNAVRDRVIAEIDKDYTNDKTHALLAHLQKTFTEAHIA
jgi:protein required for attachment to host cells